MNCDSELWRVFAPSFGKNPCFPHAIPAPHRPRCRSSAERGLRLFPSQLAVHPANPAPTERAVTHPPDHVATRSLVSVLSQRSASEPRDNPLPLKAISVPALADQITPQRPTPRFRAALDFWTPVGLGLAGCRRLLSVAPQSPVAKPLPPPHTGATAQPAPANSRFATPTARSTTPSHGPHRDSRTGTAPACQLLAPARPPLHAGRLKCRRTCDTGTTLREVARGIPAGKGRVQRGARPPAATGGTGADLPLRSPP
jgi:hypothetical protein